MTKQRSGATDSKPKSDLTDDDRKQLLEAAIQKNEKLAESGLEMAKLFIAKGKKTIAKRRLKEIVQQFEDSLAAQEAKILLKKM